jgi:hypothetical protein
VVMLARLDLQLVRRLCAPRPPRVVTDITSAGANDVVEEEPEVVLGHSLLRVSEDISLSL